MSGIVRRDGKYRAQFTVFGPTCYTQAEAEVTRDVIREKLERVKLLRKPLKVSRRDEPSAPSRD
jgi:hypothetical protein